MWYRYTMSPGVIPYYCVSCFCFYAITGTTWWIFHLIFKHLTYAPFTLWSSLINLQNMFFRTWVILFPMTVVCNDPCVIKVFIIHYSGLPVGEINMHISLLHCVFSRGFVLSLNHYLVQYNHHRQNHHSKQQTLPLLILYASIKPVKNYTINTCRLTDYLTFVMHSGPIDLLS